MNNMENKQHIYKTVNLPLQMKLCAIGLEIVEVEKQETRDGHHRVCLAFEITDDKIGAFKEIMESRKERIPEELFQELKKLRHEKLQEYFDKFIDKE